MNAAARIAIAAITPSPTNPRKYFDEAKLAELADSIKRHDVIQPVLLRPNGSPDTYELVAGERRWRAARAAGLVDIPATVRTLTDAEVLEIQVIENLQRSDLHELEEAEGYEKLLKCKHDGGEHYTVDEIAAKVGKSRGYVYARLKLCALCPEARKAFYAGELDASRALLIARIGHHDTQRQAMKEILSGRYGNGEAMSYREAHQHILNNFMLALKSAPFDTKDEALHKKAGACGPCPKRTGNQADLFGDVKSADVCTDPKCFDEKRQAHYGVTAKQLEADGFKVIAGDEAKKALPQWQHHRAGSSYIQLGGGLIRLDENTYVEGRGYVKPRAILGKEYKPTKLQHPLTGEIFDVATSQALAAAVKKTKKATPAKATTERKLREAKPDPEAVLGQRLFKAVLEKLPNVLGRRELRLLCENLMDAAENTELIADDFLPLKNENKHDWFSANEALYKGIEKGLPEGELAALAIALAISPQFTYGTEREVTAKLFGVDVAKVKKAIADEDKAAAEAAKAGAKKKPPTAAKAKGLGRPMPSVAPVITPLIKQLNVKPVVTPEPTKAKKKKAAAK